MASVSTATPTDLRTQRAGFAYGLAAYLAWGVAPLYFKLLQAVSPWEIVAHRIAWSAVLLVALLAWRKQLRRTWVDLHHRVTLVLLIGTACLITTNWLLFIYAITSGQLVQASLGYFINPLVNVLLGAVLLRERLRPVQWVAIGFAAAGVAYRTSALSGLPWIALTLAVSFALYGLLRKLARVDALAGLTIETCLATPFAIAYLFVLQARGALTFGNATAQVNLLLPLAGIVTALPLLWFTNAARRLPLSTIGLLQYLAPTLQFLIAVAVFGEPFSTDQLAAFVLIWAGLVIFTTESLHRHLRRRPAAAPDPVSASPAPPAAEAAGTR